jgi:hypothetical protein
VIAENIEGTFLFYSAEDPAGTFQWQSELKPEMAQRVINSYSAELFRVGVDEFEWLRRLNRPVDETPSLKLHKARPRPRKLKSKLR